MKVKRISKDAVLPKKEHAGDLGYDLYAACDINIYPGTSELISTGIAVEFPDGYGGLIRDRSSVSQRLLFVFAGVIDQGYTGEIKIAMYNAGNERQHIKKGSKIAQMILIPTVNFAVTEVDEIVSADQRGESGFGSTGT